VYSVSPEVPVVAGSVSGMAWAQLIEGGGPRRCSFCGRREDAVEHLVQARGVYICDGCVALAQEAIARAPGDRRRLRIRPRLALPENRDAAEEAIERAFETAFVGDAPTSERCDAIEGGANLGPTIEQANARFPRRELDFSVEYIRFLEETEAEVHMVFIWPGDGRYPETGHAMLAGGTWKVARTTWCGLVRRIGVQCPPPPD
jgi:hypothetical protein